LTEKNKGILYCVTAMFLIKTNCHNYIVEFRNTHSHLL